MKRLAFSLLLLPTCAFAINGFYDIGYGAKARGMGGVGIALPQDSLAAAYNPAGMVLVGDRVDIGTEWIGLYGSTRDVTNGRFASSENYTFPEAGLNWMICEDQALGISFYMKGLFDVHYKKGLPLISGNTQRVRSEYHQYCITPSWAWMINDCNFLGVAINASFARANFVDLGTFPNPSTHPDLTSSHGGWTSWGGGATFGWIGHFWNRFSLGLVYQTKTWFQKFKRFRGFLPDRGDFDTPPLLGGGVAVCVLPELVVAFDFQRVFWNDTEAFGNTSSSLNPYGSKNGPGFGWEDTFVAKFGIAYDVFDAFTLRLGYNYGHSPISTSEVIINALTLATIEHHVTAGLSYWWGKNELTAAYVHGFSNKITRSVSNTDWQTIENKQDAFSVSYGRCF